MCPRASTNPIAAALLLVFGLAAGGCGGSAVTELVGPGPRCQVTLNAPGGMVAATGGRMSLNVVVPRDCTWAATADAPWVQVSPAAGQGEAPLVLVVAANDRMQVRSARVIVNDQAILVIRQAEAPEDAGAAADAEKPDPPVAADDDREDPPTGPIVAKPQPPADAGTVTDGNGSGGDAVDDDGPDGGRHKDKKDKDDKDKKEKEKKPKKDKDEKEDNDHDADLQEA